MIGGWGLGYWLRVYNDIYIYIYTYKGEFFSNFMVTGSYPGRVSGRVSGFFDKTQTRLGLVSGFFFLKKKNPYPTLFFIKLGKIRPIRVWPGRYLRVGSKFPSLCVTVCVFENWDRTLGFCKLEAKEEICSIGFAKGWRKTNKSQGRLELMVWRLWVLIATM